MKQLVNKIFLLFFSIIWVSCAGVKLVEDRHPFQETKERKEYTYSYFVPFFRYVTTPIDMDSFCYRKPWKSLSVHGTALGGLISFATLGIVEPMKTEADCALK